MKKFLLFCFFAGSLAADWAEDRLSEMSLEEKIGQLFIIPACPTRGEDHLQDLQNALEKFHVGGVILKQGRAEDQLRLISWLQELSTIPLLCVSDAEWGLGMRLTDTLSFPRNLLLGAIQDKSLIAQLGYEIGRQCKRVGIQINLAPVVDVNSNPRNPIIHTRSFGEDPCAVAERGILFMKGHQAAGVLACAKHFPGHGDTTIDSHVDLPTVPHTLDRLESVELFPFKRMIEEGALCIMTAHLFVPHLDFEEPVTFSRKIVTDLLQKKMGFNGIVISDALNMQALAKYHKPDEIALKAYLAGHDLLLYGDHISPNVDEILRQQLPLAINALKSVPLPDLDERVLKILRLKQKLQSPLPAYEHLDEDLHTASAYELKQELFRSAITLLKNEGGLLPLSPTASIRWVRLGQNIEERGSESPDYLVLELFKCSAENLRIAETLLKKGLPTILIHNTSPYELPQLSCDAIILAYSSDEDAQEAAYDVIFGKLKPKGRLPVTISPNYPCGSGL